MELGQEKLFFIRIPESRDVDVEIKCAVLDFFADGLDVAMAINGSDYVDIRLAGKNNEHSDGIIKFAVHLNKLNFFA